MCSQSPWIISAVASGNRQYSTNRAGVYTQIRPVSPAGKGWPSGPTILTALPGHTWPTEVRCALPRLCSAAVRQATKLPVSAAAYGWTSSQGNSSMKRRSSSYGVGAPP